LASQVTSIGPAHLDSVHVGNLNGKLVKVGGEVGALIEIVGKGGGTRLLGGKALGRMRLAKVEPPRGEAARGLVLLGLGGDPLVAGVMAGTVIDGLSAETADFLKDFFFVSYPRYNRRSVASRNP